MNRKTAHQLGIGLDVGTANVRCVVGMMEAEGSAISVIGVGEAPNQGMRKGVVIDLEETVSAISQAVEDAQRMAGSPVSHASLGANGNHLIAVGSHGIVAIGAGSREITEADLVRVEEAATVIQMPPNREIIQAFPRSYQIDGQSDIKDPVGMSGVRLEVDACLITAATPFIKNLARCVQQAGLTINNLMANPLAASLTVADKRLREQGCVVIDLGAGTTGVAVFNEGELVHLSVLPVGASNITNDLAIGLKTEISVAEKVKLEHVNAASSKNADRNIKIKDAAGKDVIVSTREINLIALARLEEIFDQVNHELKKAKQDGLLPGGAILCGGGAKLGGIDEIAKATLNLPTRVIKPQGFTGLIDKIGQPGFACALGLMVADMHSGGAAGGSFSLPSMNGLAGPLKNFIQRLMRRPDKS